MIKKVLWLLCMHGCCIAAMPQNTGTPKPAKPYAFSSVNQVGLLGSEWGSYFQFQTVNGIRYKTWFAGIGAGMDFYRIKSIPVFIDLRKDILSGKHTPFVYADGGVHFSSFNNDHERWHKMIYTDGIFYDIGLGYKLRAQGRNAFLLSGGYSYKTVVEKLIYLANCDNCRENITTYTHRFNRLSLKVGWQF